MLMMSNKFYDVLNKIQRWLPSLGALYLGLCHIWGFPFGDKVNETVALVATFLATTLEISTGEYRKAQREAQEAIWEMAEDEQRPADEINLEDVIHQSEEALG